MSRRIYRLFTEKKSDYDLEAQQLAKEIRDYLRIPGVERVRLLNRYDIDGITPEVYEQAKGLIFSDLAVDLVYEEKLPVEEGWRVLAMEYLPGQYDQRADSAAQALQILDPTSEPVVKTAKLLLLAGEISNEEFQKLKEYYINPLDLREANLEKPVSLLQEITFPGEVEVLSNFIKMDRDELGALQGELGLAMSCEDLLFCQEYFREEEKRDPSITEIRVLDTYWSDHCRHTTFMTEIEEVEIKEGDYSPVFKEAYQSYLNSREEVYGDRRKQDKKLCLMDLATIAMKKMRKQGLLEDLEESEEINACSIRVTVDVDGEDQEWLVMFKNETHNHPTEIEPFGGAATCLGGAIRDPLSGRSYVYQAMRVTGCGDPRITIEDTLPGKLPQRKITLGAAAGYSSYGNQIGLPAGQVCEVYDEDFVTKRMELGAVIAAAPASNVRREKSEPGDVIILLGGRTGRDGCGAATGSSKEHTEESLYTCGSEVQKGNPLIERRIQRLFRKTEVSRMIKKCNDFGAGGVAVAVGELADGLEINLDLVPVKYEGLNGTELAISESQERMAVVIEPADVKTFISAATNEGLEATKVATVTEKKRLKITWQGKTIVDMSREFLDTSGVRQRTKVLVASPVPQKNIFQQSPPELKEADLNTAWLKNLERLNVCSQRGLIERFDSTVGAGTVLMPLGGKYQVTPAESMVAKIPVLEGETSTGTIMSFGYNPQIGKWSPFHGAFYAVIEAVTKVVASGGDYQGIRLTLQEYFEKLGEDREKWGKPFAALLGAYYAQMKLGLPAVGGKDSMSGSFMEMSVPPTLVAFAVKTFNVNKVLSPEFKAEGSQVVLLSAIKNEYELLDLEGWTRQLQLVTKLNGKGKILAAASVREGGIAAALSKMSFGNNIGFTFHQEVNAEKLFAPDYGSLLLEIPGNEDLDSLFGETNYKLLGKTQNEPVIKVNGIEIPLNLAKDKWETTLEEVFPTKTQEQADKPQQIPLKEGRKSKTSFPVARPRVFIPIFPGTTGEYETEQAFSNAGGKVETLLFKNLNQQDIEESLESMVKKINNAQILVLPGGMSAGNEPDGAGKFIAAILRRPRIKEAVMELLKARDGLILGIGDGFQALIKLGLLPYGEIRARKENAPALITNACVQHVSRLVQLKVISTLSPWLSKVKPGNLVCEAFSNAEGCLVASKEEINQWATNGQIATQFVDLEGNPTYDPDFNPSGALEAIEGITSPDGKIFGKMGHSERMGRNVAKNVPGVKELQIFAAGVDYFS